MQTVVVSKHIFGVLCVTGATLAWSTAGFFTLSVSVDAPSVLVWRGLFGIAGLLLLLIFREGSQGIAGFAQLGMMGWGFAAFGAISVLMNIIALRETSVTHVAIIYATTPFFAAGLGWIFLREHPNPTAIIASIIALVGAVIMIGLGADGTLFGDALAFVSAIAFAGVIVIARRNPGIPNLPAAILAVAMSTIIAGPFMSDFAVPYDDLPMLAAFGIVNSALGIALFFIGSKQLPAVQSALITALETPLAPFWIWLAFGTVPGLLTLVGGSIVVAAVIWHILKDTA
jgi:drug/metabolite transporter (DMT)-like permease